MFRDLLVHVGGSAAGRRRVQLALGLAAHAGAKLSGLHVTPPAEVSHTFKPSRVAEALAEFSARLALDARAAADIFKQEVGQQPVSTLWFQAEGDVVQCVCDRARYVDLVILGQSEKQQPAESHPLPIAHSVALHSGRPVLVVPSACHSSTFDRIVVAWDGSREAVRAVHDALPLLKLSRLVQILTLATSAKRDGGTNADAGSLLSHLGNHGIPAAEHLITLRTGREHVELSHQIDQGKYNLAVMGAYSHSPWLEFVFGGATQTILSSSAIPVLVSH